MTRFPVSTAFLAATASALFSSTAWAQQSSPEYDRYGWGPHMMGWGGGWFGMIFGPIFMIRWVNGERGLIGKMMRKSMMILISLVCLELHILI